MKLKKYHEPVRDFGYNQTEGNDVKSWMLFKYLLLALASDDVSRDDNQ